MVPCWIVGIKEGFLLLRTAAPESEISSGRVVLEAYGREHLAKLTGEITEANFSLKDKDCVEKRKSDGYILVNEKLDEISDQHLFAVEIISRVRLEVVRFKCRVLASTMDIYLNLDSKIVKGAIIDVSETGIGMTVPVKLEKSQTIRILIIAPKAKLEMKGEVRYCLLVEGEKESYRVGLLLTMRDPLTKKQWHEIVKNTQGDDIFVQEEAG